MKTSRGFTLIELLIVIAIIGILMALLFPAVGSAIDAARKAQSKNDVTQIATAVIAYETEYGKLPITNSSAVDVGPALMAILTGVSGNTANPREIVFLESNQAKRGKSGTNASGAFLDPWSILEGTVTPYKIAVDGDYDNTIAAAGASSPYNSSVSNLRKKVAVWSEPEGKNDAQKKRRSVTSWD